MPTNPHVEPVDTLFTVYKGISIIAMPRLSDGVYHLTCGLRCPDTGTVTYLTGHDVVKKNALRKVKAAIIEAFKKYPKATDFPGSVTY